MNITQLTDEQLLRQQDNLWQIYDASCDLGNDYTELEKALDAHYHEVNRRGIFQYV